MKIAFVREAEGKLTRVGIGEGKDVTRYYVTRAAGERLGLTPCGEIDEYTLSLLIEEDERCRAMSRALSLLSYGDNTKSQLFMKLRRAGFGKEVCERCVAECVRLGYVDEVRQVEGAVINEANRALRGRQYIMKKLSAKGYSVRDISEAIDKLVRLGEIDFHKNLVTLCERLGAETEEECRAVMYKYGYRGSDFD